MLLLLIIVAVLLVLFNARENWGTSPGVFDQLASNSGYYPYWQYGWPYGGRRRYRSLEYQPGWGTWWNAPRPWGWY